MTNQRVSFDMPKAAGFEVHRWDRDLIEQQVEGDLVVTPALSHDVVTLIDGNLDDGDVAVVQSIGALDGDGAQRMFSITESSDGLLVGTLEREAQLFAIDGEGTWRSVSDALYVTPTGELTATAALPDGASAFVSKIRDGAGSRVMKWTVADTGPGVDEPEVEFDIRAYESTAAAYEAIRNAEDLTTRTIVEVASEDVVGVVVQANGRPYVVAVTESAGDFESFESPRDLALTLAAGTDPKVLREGAVQASLGGLEIAEVLVHGERLDLPTTSDIAALLDTPPRHVDVVEPAPQAQQDQLVTWAPETETFRAVVVDLDDHGRPSSEPRVFGTRRQEFATAASLLGALENADVTPSAQSRASISAIEATQDGATFVGVQGPNGPILSIVSPSLRVEPLPGSAEHSPDGPNWGYSGNGPRETAAVFADRVAGPGAPDAADNKQRILDGIVAGLPAEFSIRAKDIATFLDGGPRPLVDTDGGDIGAARQSAAGLAAPDVAEIDLRAPTRDLEMGDIEL